MNSSLFKLQAAFLTAGDVEFPTTDKNLIDNAYNLVEEESVEFAEESAYVDDPKNNLNDLKECIDLIYVACQYMNQSVGVDKAELLFNAVHANNMDKCIDGKLVKSVTGKILKPEGFNKNAWVPEFQKILGH